MLAKLREALSLLDDYNTTCTGLSTPYNEEVFTPHNRRPFIGCWLAHSLYTHSTEDVGIFFWDVGQSPETCNCFHPRQADAPCVVDEIAMPELICLAHSIKAQEGEDPVVLMARKLGLKHLREATRPRLEKAWGLGKGRTARQHGQDLTGGEII